jgi:signal transduction histidine kinase
MSLPSPNACVKAKHLTPNSLPYTTENEDGCQGIILYIFQRQIGEADFTVVSITDSGTGISEVQLPYLFERFYRVEEPAPAIRAEWGLALRSRTSS